MRFVALLALVGLLSSPANAMNAQDEIAAGCAHAVVQFANSYLQAMREGVTEEAAISFLHKSSMRPRQMPRLSAKIHAPTEPCSSGW